MVHFTLPCVRCWEKAKVIAAMAPEKPHNTFFFVASATTTVPLICCATLMHSAVWQRIVHTIL